MTAYTFAVTGFPRPPLITRRRRERAALFISTMEELGDTMIGVSNAGPVLLVHMRTENDAIIAKNRLRFCGFDVSEETHKVEFNEVKGEGDAPDD